MKKLLSFSAVIVLFFIILFISQYYYFIDGKLHVIICDVGQGDAVLIITPERKHILIDGGPDQSVLSCLADNLPFWERTIDVVLVTHPHADHLIGMHYVVDRYIVKRFVSIELSSPSVSYVQLHKKLTEKSIPKTYLYAENKFMPEKNLTFRVLSPTREYLTTVSPTGEMKEGAENASLITHLSYGKFSMLFAGDSPSEGLQKALQKISQVTILPLAHHGSKTSTTEEILMHLAPRYTIASVGKNNDYGHPSKEVIGLIKKFNIPLLRTDQVGDIRITTDGLELRID